MSCNLQHDESYAEPPVAKKPRGVHSNSSPSIIPGSSPGQLPHWRIWHLSSETDQHPNSNPDAASTSHMQLFETHSTQQQYMHAAAAHPSSEQHLHALPSQRLPDPPPNSPYDPTLVQQSQSYQCLYPSQAIYGNPQLPAVRHAQSFPRSFSSTLMPSGVPTQCSLSPHQYSPLPFQQHSISPHQHSNQGAKNTPQELCYQLPIYGGQQSSLITPGQSSLNFLPVKVSLSPTSSDLPIQSQPPSQHQELQEQHTSLSIRGEDSSSLPSISPDFTPGQFSHWRIRHLSSETDQHSNTNPAIASTSHMQLYQTHSTQRAAVHSSSEQLSHAPGSPSNFLYDPTLVLRSQYYQCLNPSQAIYVSPQLPACRHAQSFPQSFSSTLMPSDMQTRYSLSPHQCSPIPIPQHSISPNQHYNHGAENTSQELYYQLPVCGGQQSTLITPGQSTLNLQPPSKRLKLQDQSTHPSTNSLSHQPIFGTVSQHMKRYISYLQLVFQAQLIPTYSKFPPTISEKYINLALVKKGRISKSDADKFTKATIRGEIDDIYKRKKKFSFDDVAQLNEERFPQLVVVEGAPGVGKSTFAWEVCRRWSDGSILMHYKLVVLLRCRDKWVQEAKSISDLFRMPGEPQNTLRNVVAEVKKCWGKGLLLLIEGYDELPQSIRCDHSSLLVKLITGTNSELPGATMLVTSRPSASNFLHTECEGRISQHVEILGFTKENVESYLKSVTRDNPDIVCGLQQYLDCYPHIRGMMYIPLNCAIIVTVYQENRIGSQVFPKTKTELYSSLIRTLLLRYLHDHPKYGKQKWSLQSFSDLPPEIFAQFYELSKTAHGGISNNQQVIFSNLPEDFESLGLMQSVPELYTSESTTTSSSSNFLHLTMQEYMAAWYLSYSPPEISPFQAYGLQPQTFSHYQVVLRFLAGLTKMAEFENNELLISFLTNKKSYLTHNALRWVFESQTWEIFRTVSKDSSIEFSVKDLTDVYDYFLLGFSIAASGCEWKLANLTMKEERIAMLVSGTEEAQSDNRGCFSGIYIRHDVTSKHIKTLLKFSEIPVSMMKMTAKVYIKNMYVTNVNYQQMTKLCDAFRDRPYLSITSIDSHNCRFKNVLQFCRMSCGALKSLTLSDCSLCVEDCQMLRAILSSPTSLLESLNVDGNNLSTESCDDLFAGLKNNASLRMLSMKGTEVPQIILAAFVGTDDRVCRICMTKCDLNVINVRAVRSTATLEQCIVKRVDCYCYELVECVNLLWALAKLNVQPRKLILSDGCVGPEGCQVLGQLLASKTIQLDELDVSEYLTVDLIDALLDGLKSNNYLKKLTLKGSCVQQLQFVTAVLSIRAALEGIYLNGCNILLGSASFTQYTDPCYKPLTVNCTKKEIALELIPCFAARDFGPLKLCMLNCSLDKDDCRRISVLLEIPTTKLEVLDVGFCNLTAEGIAALAPTNTSHLKCLNLQGNEIGKTGAVVLVKSLEAHAPLLKKLDLRRTNIGVEDCQSLSKLLSLQTSQLQELDVGFCNLTAEAISALAPTNTSHLKCLNFQGNEIGKTGAVVLVKSLEAHAPLLRELDLYETNIGVEDCQSLSKLLSSQTSQLEELDVGFCNLTAEAISALAPTNTSHLKCLSLQGNEIGKTGAVVLVKSLEAHAPLLKKLDLYGTNIGVEDCQSLSKLLSSQTSQLEELDVGFCNLTAEAIAALAPTNTSHLKCLSLQGNKIGKTGAVVLVKSLEAHAPLLKKLDLYGINIGVEDCQSLSKLLSSQTSQLEELDVGFCNLTAEAISALAPTNTSHLKCLSLQGNEIGKTGAVVLVKSLEAHAPLLKKLDLYGTNIGVEDCQSLSKLLSSQTSLLEELDVGFCNLTAVAIAALAPTNTSHLKCLHLQGNEIGKTGAVVLVKSLEAHAPLLRELDLCGTNIGVEDCQSLSKLLSSQTSQLEELNVGFCNLTAEAIAALAPTNTSHLECLNLKCNQIGKTGAVVLVKSLDAYAPLLKKLDLSGTNVGVEDCQSLSKLLSSQTSQLQELYVGFCNLTAEAIAALAPTNTSHLKCLSLQGNEIGKTGAVVLVKSLEAHAPLLRELDLFDSKIGVEDCQSLSKLLSSQTSQLEELDVGFCNLTAEAIAALAPTNTSHLKCLHLQDNEIGKTGAVVLVKSLEAHAPLLRELDLWKTNIGVEDCQSLSKLLSSQTSQLEELDVGCCNLTAKAIAALAPTNTSHLKCLSLKDNEIGKTGAVVLVKSLEAHAPLLKKLDLCGTKIGVEDCRYLSKLLSSQTSQLEELDVGFCNLVAEAISALAPTNTSYLKCLSLKDNEIGKTGAVVLVKSLEAHAPLLKKLNLWRTNIGVEDCQSLSKLLSSQTSQLEELDVSRCNLTAEAIAALAPTNTSHLKCLDLKCNKIGKTGAVVLVKSLEAHAPLLRELDLYGTNIGVEDCQTLSKLLSSQTSQLQELNVGFCNLTAEAIAALAPTNTSHLKYLSLQGNKIGKTGAVVLVKSLEAHAPLLKKLDLWGTNIGVEDCQSLSKLLSSQTSQLQELNVGFCNLTTEAISALAPTNTSHLKCLNLKDNVVGKTGAVVLVKLLKAHAPLLKKPDLGKQRSV